jgi:hypothetical protein
LPLATPNGAKKLFYSDEGDGYWPDTDELERIRDYLAAVG